MDWHDSEYGQVAESCKHDHEPPGLEYGAPGLLGRVKWLKFNVFSVPSSGCQRNCRYMWFGWIYKQNHVKQFSCSAMWAHQSDDWREDVSTLEGGEGVAEKAKSLRVSRQPHHKKWTIPLHSSEFHPCLLSLLPPLPSGYTFSFHTPDWCAHIAEQLNSSHACTYIFTQTTRTGSFSDTCLIEPKRRLASSACLNHLRLHNPESPASSVHGGEILKPHVAFGFYKMQEISWQAEEL
jgi:hypothetical protein